ncbi:putative OXIDOREDUCTASE PROTEIN; zinc-containing alcohol dehydrogenase family, Quinone oxidoreductase subfamily [Cupriavidus taiwanensis]|uniref:OXIDOREDUCTASE PROTEIN zinc-containing alcohol dehydrogenase family, Quinone oxidoreductase subfamily n=1 Tax=Cupriavidus taiwanensis TaxID=164546 RepID=A0A375EFQ6_9BURK|nr:NADPH:quinone oxidoreductase family protein [Cupriavidus taiwanensis]ULX54434.1 NADPH:quinone oxidoreductase [Cupriavidus taiwanensis]SOZ16938.1 putative OXIDOREDUCTASE PROTEIN; zinc-containing alcohol dehydrogenase family, Quinone oxidoreductase subfamily [Cupriavidus taiwanensis]SOZ22682.1 putative OXIDOREDUCTASE PROTEIN; zinc-containing alcohol dehydrogenase family, Quinone oxidoreductase subfamily [Cupriavidus taiwanensis]SOZ42386.1 putative OXIDOREDUCTASE PROTEIN; zinc-containing alcoho
MKAVLCKAWGPPDSLTLETLPDLVPGKGEVVIDVKAAAVNFPDVLIIQNKYQAKPELPFTPGSELAGVVNAVGEGVTHVKPGDKVIAYLGNGAFASQAKAPAASVVPMPPGIDFETAAAFTLTYGTSHHAVIDRGELKAGQTMLVLGAAGGVGLAAIEIGKAIGARVIAAASTDEKLEVCKQHGADALINYSTEDLRERIKALTDGKGPDVVYDPVGGIYAEPAFRSIGWRGRYLVVGFANGEIPRLPLNLALLKGASLVGVFWGDFVRREPKANQANMAQMLGWMKEGKIRPHISARYPLEQAAQALKDMEARKVTGKIVIVP